MSVVQERSSLPLSYTSSFEDSRPHWLGGGAGGAGGAGSGGECRCATDDLYNTIAKLEQEARLAAEIGQTLLHKHDALKRESAQLEKQLAASHEKSRHLELLLQDQDTALEHLAEKHSRAIWEHHKTEQTLRETEADLELANARHAQLMNDVKAQAADLRSTKMALRQADAREHNTRAKLEDAKQELVAAQKAERAIESKHKKLQARYDWLHTAYERLKLEDAKQVSEADDLAWLRESNERLRNDVIALSKTLQPSESRQRQQHRIKDLQDANQQLTNDLLECRARLSDTQAQMEQLLLAPPDHSESIILAQPQPKPVPSLPLAHPMSTIHHHHHHFLHPHDSIKDIQDAAVQTRDNDDDAARESRKLLDQLRATDMRTLNRSLHRAFDIAEMNETSNRMIQSILSAMEPADKVSRDMLTEIGQLRMTINDLQLAYVSKIQQQENSMLLREQQRDGSASPTILERFMGIMSTAPEGGSPTPDVADDASKAPGQTTLSRLQSWTADQVTKTRRSMLRPPSVDHAVPQNSNPS